MCYVLVSNLKMNRYVCGVRQRASDAPYSTTIVKPIVGVGMGRGRQKKTASRFFGLFFFLRNWANSPLPLSVLSVAGGGAMTSPAHPNRQTFAALQKECGGGPPQRVQPQVWFYFRQVPPMCTV